MKTILIISFIIVAILSSPGASTNDLRHGIASWYGFELKGSPMANGSPFNPNAMTCASWDYPLGTKLRILYGNKSVNVIVTDRGPNKRLHRIIDLSRSAFDKLEDLKKGLIEVDIQMIH